MYNVFIDSEKCKGCGLCESVCPKGVIKTSTSKCNQKGYYYSEIVDKEKCIGCTFCAQVCPDLVISIEKERGDKCG